MMTAAERPFTAILQDIIRNFQEITRSEVRLAKVEIREEMTKAKQSMTVLGAGAVIGLYAGLFLLMALFFGLALVMPMWAASLTVGVVLGAIAAMLLTSGIRQFRRIHPTPQRTVETIKENVEWARQHAR
jgi:uncharacterized membrane protein